MGEVEAADAPLSELFLLEPDLPLSPDQSPKIRRIFERSRDRVRARRAKREKEEREARRQAIRFENLTPSTYDADSPVEFRLRIKDPSELIASVMVHYRLSGDAPSRSLALESNSSTWLTRLTPGSPRVEYFVDAIDTTETPVPGLWSETDPRVLVARKETSWTENPWIWSGIGLGVVASVVTAVLVLNGDDDPETDLRFDL